MGMQDGQNSRSCKAWGLPPKRFVFRNLTSNELFQDSKQSTSELSTYACSLRTIHMAKGTFNAGMESYDKDKKQTEVVKKTYLLSIQAFRVEIHAW